MPFEPVQRTRTFEQVLHQLEGMIRRGELRPGDRLPNERTLAELLGVGRPSVREALRVLEGLELITVRPGTGPSSGSIVADTAGAALSSLLGLHLALGHFDTDELVETRLVLEIWAARTAAKERTAAQLAELAAVLDALEAAVDDRERYLAIDTQFHLTVASAAGNRLLRHLMEALRAPIVELLQARAGAWSDWSALLGRAHPDHRALYDAIAAGDPNTAEDVIRHHLSFYDGESPGSQT